MKGRNRRAFLVRQGPTEMELVAVLRITVVAYRAPQEPIVTLAHQSAQRVHGEKYQMQGPACVSTPGTVRLITYKLTERRRRWVTLFLVQDQEKRLTIPGL